MGLNELVKTWKIQEICHFISFSSLTVLWSVQFMTQCTLYRPQSISSVQLSITENPIEPRSPYGFYGREEFSFSRSLCGTLMITQFWFQVRSPNPTVITLLIPKDMRRKLSFVAFLITSQFSLLSVLVMLVVNVWFKQNALYTYFSIAHLFPYFLLFS